MIRGFTYYNQTTHSFNVDGDHVTPLHVGTWKITVEVHYDMSIWLLEETLGAKQYENSFFLTIVEGEEQEVEAENNNEFDSAWEPFQPNWPDTDAERRQVLPEDFKGQIVRQP